MKQIVFIAQGSNALVGNFETGGLARVDDALAAHLVKEARVAKYADEAAQKPVDAKPAKPPAKAVQKPVDAKPAAPKPAPKAAPARPTLKLKPRSHK